MCQSATPGSYLTRDQVANPTGEHRSHRLPLGDPRPERAAATHHRLRATWTRATNGWHQLAGAVPSRHYERRLGAVRTASPRSTVEMIGSPFITRRELQQFPPCAGEATLTGQLAQPVCHFSIVRPVNRQGADLWLVHR